MATLINNIRLRVGAIITLSIGIHILRATAAPGVVKATATLSFNYVVYAAILLLSIVPHKSAWGTAVVFQILTVANDVFSVVLGTIATTRCLSSKQTGCVELALQSIACLLLLGFVTLMDVYQLWNIYLCLRQKTFTSSAAQRVRILFAWALPFGWLVNVVLLSESNMALLATPHLAIDPMMIMMARSQEPMFLSVLCGIVFATDLVHYITATSTLVRGAIVVQLALTVVGGAMLVFTKVNTNKQPAKPSVLPNTPVLVVPGVSAKAVTGDLRQRKSKKLEF